MSQDRKVAKQEMLERLGGKAGKRDSLVNEGFEKLGNRMEDLEIPPHSPEPAQKRQEKVPNFYLSLIFRFCASRKRKQSCK